MLFLMHIIFASNNDKYFSPKLQNKKKFRCNVNTKIFRLYLTRRLTDPIHTHFVTLDCFPLIQTRIFVELSLFHQIEDLQMERKSNAKINSYKFSQIFGYKGPNERLQQDDVITCLKFDNEGKNIALGDKAGRVIIFQQTKSNEKITNPFEYITEFQSHERQFDALRSKDIDESVVDINWLNKQGKYKKLITNNTHSIRLWKIYEKIDKKMVNSAGKQLAIPTFQNSKASRIADIQKIFPHRHVNHIKQTSLSQNQQYLLSTDESQMFLWDTQKPEKPYVVCDLNCGSSLEDDQVINCCQMHPKHDSLFLYGMSKGSLKLGDLRVSSKVQKNSTCYKVGGSRQRNILIDMISNISSATFSKNNKYLISRDYLTVKIWDVCNTIKPVSCIQLHEGLKSKLGEMVQNQSIYDSFKINVSSDSSTILTGSYNNCFHMMDVQSQSNYQYEVNYKKMTINRPIDKTCAPLTKMDYDKRILATDFSPNSNVVAVASLNCFFTYSL